MLTRRYGHVFTCYVSHSDADLARAIIRRFAIDRSKTAVLREILRAGINVLDSASRETAEEKP